MYKTDNRMESVYGNFCDLHFLSCLYLNNNTNQYKSDNFVNQCTTPGFRKLHPCIGLLRNHVASANVSVCLSGTFDNKLIRRRKQYKITPLKETVIASDVKISTLIQAIIFSILRALKLLTQEQS